MLSIFISALLLLAGGENLSARISLTATDKSGNQHTIVCGSHPAASLGYDTQLGELPVPPVPSNDMFDVRFLDPPALIRQPSSGSYIDVRPPFPNSHIDTFVIRIRTQAESYPIRVRWSLETVNDIPRSNLIRTIADSTISIDMVEQSEIFIRDNLVEQLVLIRSAVGAER